MNIGNVAGTYFNFILGTGSEQVGRTLKCAITKRKQLGLSLPKAIGTGLSRGVTRSYNLQKVNGGYFKNLIKGFKAIPNGWKAGKGFGKLTGALKGCGKAMPALMASIMVIGEIPNVYKAVRDKGVVQGLKEVGKSAARLTAGALGGAIGTAVGGPIGSMVGWFLGDWVASKIVGKSYSEKLAESEENKNENTKNSENNGKIVTNGQGDTATFSGSGNMPAVEDIPYPPIDADDFGPYRPYANIFYNTPEAYADMGVRMPGQSYLGSMNIASSGFGMSGMGTRNNVSPNLLDKFNDRGSLLNTQNSKVGNRLDIVAK